MDLYARGITDLDNAPTPPYLRVTLEWPALLDVSDHELGRQLLIEASDLTGLGYATYDACNAVADRWLAEWHAAHPIAA